MPDRTQAEQPSRFRVAKIDGVHCGLLRIRGVAADAVARAGAIVGTALPTAPNTTTGYSPRALWLAPGEWLIAQNRPLDSLAENFTAALAGVTWHFVDVSDGRTVYSIMGTHARDFLNRGLSLDLHPCVFPQGGCAQTIFANIPVLLHLIGDEPEFHLHVDSSFEDYLDSWIARVRAVFDPDRQT